MVPYSILFFYAAGMAPYSTITLEMEGDVRIFFDKDPYLLSILFPPCHVVIYHVSELFWVECLEEQGGYWSVSTGGVCFHPSVEEGQVEVTFFVVLDVPMVGCYCVS